MERSSRHTLVENEQVWYEMNRSFPIVNDPHKRLCIFICIYVLRHSEYCTRTHTKWLKIFSGGTRAGGNVERKSVSESL